MEATGRADKLFHNVKNPLASFVADAAQAVLMGKKVGIVKAGIALAPGAGRRRTHLSPLIQELVPIIPASRLVAGVADQGLDLRRIQPKSRAGAAHDIFLHHDRSEVVRPVFQGHLADVRALRHPRALDVGKVVQENAGKCLHAEILRHTGRPFHFQDRVLRLKVHRPTGVSEYLRMQALSRIFLDNIPNIQSSWVTQGPEIGQVALKYGANDFGRS